MTNAVYKSIDREAAGFLRWLDHDYNLVYQADFVRTVQRLTETRGSSLVSAPDARGKYSRVLPWAHVSSNCRFASSVLLRNGSGYDERSNEARYWDPSPPGQPAEDIKDLAVQKCLTKAGDAVRQLNVFLRELDDVVRLTQKFGNGVQAGLHQLIDLTKKDWTARRDMRRFLRHGWKEAPAFYLAYIFGVAPLAEDLENAVLALNDSIAADASAVVTLKATIKLEDEYEAWQYGLFGGCYYSAIIRRVLIGRAGLQFGIPLSLLSAMQFVAPFSVAYETTRLSFVLDYILPIGPWLAAVEGCQLAPYFLGGWKSFKLEDTALRAAAIGSQVITENCDVAGGYYNHYQREVISSFPYTAAFKPPRVRVPGLKQLGVVAALIGQRLNTLTKTINRR